MIFFIIFNFNDLFVKIDLFVWLDNPFITSKKWIFARELYVKNPIAYKMNQSR